jgi:hypothetical protein
MATFVGIVAKRIKFAGTSGINLCNRDREGFFLRLPCQLRRRAKYNVISDENLYMVSTHGRSSRAQVAELEGVFVAGAKVAMYLKPRIRSNISL